MSVKVIQYMSKLSTQSYFKFVYLVTLCGTVAVCKLQSSHCIGTIKSDRLDSLSKINSCRVHSNVHHHLQKLLIPIFLYFMLMKNV